jgi:hypothetical protein
VVVAGGTVVVAGGTVVVAGGTVVVAGGTVVVVAGTVVVVVGSVGTSPIPRKKLTIYSRRRNIRDISFSLLAKSNFHSDVGSSAAAMISAGIAFLETASMLIILLAPPVKPGCVSVEAESGYADRQRLR